MGVGRWQKRRSGQRKSEWDSGGVREGGEGRGEGGRGTEEG